MRVRIQTFLCTCAVELLKQTHCGNVRTCPALFPSNQRHSSFPGRPPSVRFLCADSGERKLQHKKADSLPSHLITDSDHVRAATPTCNLRHKSFTPSEFLNASSYANCKLRTDFVSSLRWKF